MHSNQGTLLEWRSTVIFFFGDCWYGLQNRMSSTSNQETFRAELDGRLVMDILRQVLPFTANPLRIPA